MSKFSLSKATKLIFSKMESFCKNVIIVRMAIIAAFSFGKPKIPVLMQGIAIVLHVY